MVIPFGLTNALATCQDVINNALHKFLNIFVVAYFNNILVYTIGMLQQHIEHVSKVFAKLEEIDFKVNLKKTKFHKQEIKYLRFIIRTKGISIDPDKVKPIQE